jgi:tetratricopeptide (TPR) repeat protein
LVTPHDGFSSGFWTVPSWIELSGLPDILKKPNFSVDEHFMRIVFAMLLTGILGLAGNEALAIDRKVALVIGNARYPDNDLPLNDAANDARDVSDDLTRDGFEVEKAIDLTGDGMRQALGRLYAKITPGSAALIFFDGFGVQSARQTYLLPVDAQIWTEPDVLRDGFNLETILGEMDGRGASVKIALLDASRRNPFERRFRRYSAGLAPAVTPANTLLLYSSALSSVVSNSRNDHSVFVTELLREMRAPGIGAEQTLRNTQAGVVSATRGEQVPWLSSSLTTDFSFTGSTGLGAGDKVSTRIEPTQTPCEVPKPYPPPNADDLAKDAKIDELSRRITADGNDKIAFYKRGQLYAVKRAYALAAKDFDEALRLDPKDAEAYNNRCWIRAAIGDLRSALSDCNEALRLKPDLFDALDSRGLVNLKLGNNTDAIWDYSESLRINPRSVSSLFGRGIARKRSGGDGSSDLELAKSMDQGIGREFAGYGVNECGP